MEEEREEGEEGEAEEEKEEGEEAKTKCPAVRRRLPPLEVSSSTNVARSLLRPCGTDTMAE